MLNKGNIIAFEGIDGCGKTTQCKLFCDYLDKRGIQYQYFSFSENFLDGNMFDKIKTSSTDEELYYKFKQAMRTYESSKSFFMNYLKYSNHRIIICERYKYACNAYLQGQGVKKQIISLLSDWLPAPDLMFYFDIDPATAIERIRSRGGQLHWHEREEYLSHILNYLKNEIECVSANLYTLDAKRNIDFLHMEICNIFMEKYKKC